MLAHGYLLLLLHRQEEEIQFTENFTLLQMSEFASHLFIPFWSLFKLEDRPLESTTRGCLRFLINTNCSEFACGECFNYVMLEFDKSPDI